MNKRQKKKQLKIQNKKLIERYPFLLPRSRWTDKVLDNYDYTYTELDSMPNGWRKAFGLMICEELREALLKDNMLESYRIVDIKEKFGQLRWYDNGGTQEIFDIIRKYEYISEHTCIICGKFDVSLFDDGWVCPYCDKCFIDRKRKEYYRYQDFSDKEFPSFNSEEVMKFRLEDEPLKTSIHMESMGKNGCKHWDIDLTDVINKLKK